MSCDPRTPIPESDEMDAIVVSWQAVLQPIPDAELQEAYLLAVRGRAQKSWGFPVNAPEIYAAWLGRSKANQVGPAAAWSLVTAATPQIPAPKQPHFDDPIINTLVKRFGWYWMTHNKDLNDVRFAFCEAYKAIADNPEVMQSGFRPAELAGPDRKQLES